MTLTFLRLGINDYINALRRQHENFSACVTFNFGQPSMLMSYKLWRQHVEKIENDGLTVPVFPKAMVPLLGHSSFIHMPAGRGKTRHGRIRTKCLRALAPKQVLAQEEELRAIFRREFERLVRESEGADGFARFMPAAHRLAFTVSAVSLIGSGNEELEEIRVNFDTFCMGLFAPPINLGRHSAYGRAKIARNRIAELVIQLLAKPS